MTSLNAEQEVTVHWLFFAGAAVMAMCYAWALIKGFESGRMTALASVRVSGHRVSEPFRFWACTAWNALFLVGIVGGLIWGLQTT